MTNPRTRARLHDTFVGISLAVALSTAALAQTPAEKPGADEAQAIAQEAYIYFYPLVTMDVTRKQLINIAPGKAGSAGR